MSDITHQVFTAAGTWETRPGKPLNWEDGAAENLLAAAGYSEFVKVGNPDGFSLTGYRINRKSNGAREDMPDFALIIDTFGSWADVYADSAAAFMELLARWTPAIRDAAVTGLIEQLTSYGTSTEAPKNWPIGVLIRDALVRQARR